MPLISALSGSLKGYLIGGVLTAVTAGVSYLYISNLKSQIELLNNNISEQERVIRQKDISISQFKNDVQQINEVNRNLISAVNEKENVIRELQEKFDVQANGQSRDLGAITRVKPNLINKIVNNATQEVNRCFEIATGANPTEGERNNECKELFNE